MSKKSRTSRAYWTGIPTIAYEGPGSANALAFRHFNPDEVIDGKPFSEHMRFSIAYWHSFRGTGSDPFGPGTIVRPWESGKDPVSVAKVRLEAGFEFFQKIRAPFWCLPRPRHRARGQDARRVEQEPRRRRRPRQAAPESHRRETALGHRQSLLQSALHVRRVDQPRRPRLRLRRRPGEERPSRSRRSSAVKTTSSGAVAKATRPCSTPT
jgi:hypothetical protein